MSCYHRVSEMFQNSKYHRTCNDNQTLTSQIKQQSVILLNIMSLKFNYLKAIWYIKYNVRENMKIKFKVVISVSIYNFKYIISFYNFMCSHSRKESTRPKSIFFQMSLDPGQICLLLYLLKISTLCLLYKLEKIDLGRQMCVYLCFLSTLRHFAESCRDIFCKKKNKFISFFPQNLSARSEFLWNHVTEQARQLGGTWGA